LAFTVAAPVAVPVAAAVVAPAAAVVAAAAGIERQRRSTTEPRVGARHERLPWVAVDQNINPNGVAHIPKGVIRSDGSDADGMTRMGGKLKGQRPATD
jgi:hypothetical protein